MQQDIFITLTGFDHYYGKLPLAIGNIVKLVKDSENCHDSEAIYAELPYVGKVAYVANSANTAAGGTFSAGRLYDKFEKICYAKIRFTSFTKVICEVFPDDYEIEQQMLRQTQKEEDEDLSF